MGVAAGIVDAAPAALSSCGHLAEEQRRPGRIQTCAHGSLALSLVRADQRLAYIVDIHRSEQAVGANDRQVPEMASGHDLGSGTDACCGVDDGPAGGYCGMDSDLVDVLLVR